MNVLQNNMNKISLNTCNMLKKAIPVLPGLIIDREAREIMRLVVSVRLSVRPSVRPSVSALTAEPFDLRP